MSRGSSDYTVIITRLWSVMISDLTCGNSHRYALDYNKFYRSSLHCYHFFLLFFYRFIFFYDAKHANHCFYLCNTFLVSVPVLRKHIFVTVLLIPLYRCPLPLIPADTFTNYPTIADTLFTFVIFHSSVILYLRGIYLYL